jgi:hypothetical protein
MEAVTRQASGDHEAGWQRDSRFYSGLYQPTPVFFNRENCSCVAVAALIKLLAVGAGAGAGAGDVVVRRRPLSSTI